MTQSVEHLTLDFSSGHDLMVARLGPGSCSTLTAGHLLGIFSLPLSLPLPGTLSLSLSQNK